MSLLDGGASAATQVKDVTTASFRQDVVADSIAQPILVDFWAPWCGPCKQLGPVIERVVAAAKGRVKLVKMNIDDHPQIAGQLGIQSIPAVIAFSKGQPIDGFVGALPESQIAGFIERLVGPIEDDAAALLEAAAALADAGDVAGAIEAYGNVLVDNGENIQALAGIIKLYVESGNLDAARGYLEAVPDGKEDDPAIVAVRAALDLAEQVASLGDTSGLEAAIAATATRWGPIDIVLSGAAGNFIAPAAGISANGFKTVVDIDLLGTFNVFRASYDHIRKPGASLIAITAGQAVQPMAGQIHACAAKAGVNMVTQCLAIEWGQFGVRVNAISPGPIADTEGMRRLIVSAEAEAAYKATLPMGHYGEKWDIAELAIFLSTDSARYISGAIIPCDGASILTGGSQASFRAS